MDCKSALKQYQTVEVHTQIDNASPHRVIQLLMQGAIDRITQAKGLVQAKRYAEKSQCINKTIDIINGLRASLNVDSGEPIATQLEQLYDFMVGHLVQANQKNSVDLLEEVEALMQTIKSGWDQIPLDAQQQFEAQTN